MRNCALGGKPPEIVLAVARHGVANTISGGMGGGWVATCVAGDFGTTFTEMLARAYKNRRIADVL